MKRGFDMYKNFMELAESRYSVRKYKTEQISKEDMELILRAGQVAPTAAIEDRSQRPLSINK